MLLQGNSSTTGPLSNELLDMAEKSVHECSDPKWTLTDPDVVIGRTSGVVFNGSQPSGVICGGQVENGKIKDTCTIFTKGATFDTPMSTERLLAASVVLDANRLFVTGGWAYDEYRLTTSANTSFLFP